MPLHHRLAGRIRDRRALRFYRRFVPRNGLCFDVGANMGDRTGLFLRLGARVVAVEPQAPCADAMRRRFQGRDVEVVEAALGDHEGTAELFVASYHTLSSLSREWTDAVRKSGRFSEFSWNETRSVPLTTLDTLVAAHGVPDFCKIDVEGYELEVLQGLSQPLPVVSFEFTVERLDSRLAAVDRLAQLGMGHFNYSEGESMRLALRRWTDPGGIREFLSEPAHSAETFGDVYAALTPP